MPISCCDSLSTQTDSITIFTYSTSKRDLVEKKKGFNHAINIENFVMGGSYFMLPNGLNENSEAIINHSYWINSRVSVMGLPLQFRLERGNAILPSNPVFTPLTTFSFSLDHQSLLNSIQQSLSNQLHELEPEWVTNFRNLQIEDSIYSFNTLQGLLNDSLYKDQLSKARNVIAYQIDSIHRGYSIDSCLTVWADSIDEKHGVIKDRFRELMKFQEKYQELEAVYLVYQESIADKIESIENIKNSTVTFPKIRAGQNY